MLICVIASLGRRPKAHIAQKGPASELHHVCPSKRVNVSYGQTSIAPKPRVCPQVFSTKRVWKGHLHTATCLIRDGYVGELVAEDAAVDPTVVWVTTSINVAL